MFMIGCLCSFLVAFAISYRMNRYRRGIWTWKQVQEGTLLSFGATIFYVIIVNLIFFEGQERFGIPADVLAFFVGYPLGWIVAAIRTVPQPVRVNC